jgi:G3E family GTPase
LNNLANAGFSSKAAYIFRKQIEEADFVVINRIDELPTSAVQELTELIHQQFPDRPVLQVSAKTGAGFDKLIEFLEQRGEFGRRMMALDYDIYAEGEAELGWLNSQLKVTAAKQFDLDPLLLSIVEHLRGQFAMSGAETAHLKTIGLADGCYGVANLVSSFTPSELSVPSNGKVTAAEVVINARVAIDPEELAKLVRETVAATCKAVGAVGKIETLQSFRPGRPVPTHRISTVPA